MVIAQLALFLAAGFAATALYVLWVEQPARLALDDRAALAQWKPSYARGKIMQASIAALSGLLALVAWWQSWNPLWLVGALLILAPWPFTIFVILPTNHRLEETPANAPTPETRALLIAWGNYHAVRAALGTAAAVIMLIALFWRP